MLPDVVEVERLLQVVPPVAHGVGRAVLQLLRDERPLRAC